MGARFANSGRRRPRGLGAWAKALALAAVLSGAGIARGDGPVYGCDESDLDTAVAQGGYVYFTQDCNITITMPIEIVTNTTLNAQGYTVSISGGGIGPMFQVDSGVIFSNIGLTITGGDNTNGGAYYILDGAFVTLTNCTVSACAAVGFSGYNGLNGASSQEGNGSGGRNGTNGLPGLGGAIYNLGNLTLLNCVLTNNNATGGQGGQGGAGGNGNATQGYSGGNGGSGDYGGGGYGGAVYTAQHGTLFVSNCTFAGNSAIGGAGGQGGAGGSGAPNGLSGGGGAGGAASGGGVYCTNSQALVVNSIFYGNSVQGGNSAGGGQDKENGQGIDGQNGGSGSGGGLCCLGGGMVTNCTFFTNTVTGGSGGQGGDAITGNGGKGGNGGNASGGGIYGTGLVSVVSCTIADCSAFGGAAGTNGAGGGAAVPSSGVGRGGGLASGGGTFLVMNSILSTNVVAPTNGLATNIFALTGQIIDGGYNIATDASQFWTNKHTLKKTDPKVFYPAWNGGYTMTMALSNSSPALDAIPLTSPFPPIDQRGVHRPLGITPDIGAYELATSAAIIQQPLSVVQTNGNDVTLGVSAAGAAGLRLFYWWRFYGTNVMTPTNVPGQTSASYEFLPLQLTNAGYYDVVVSNRLGAVTSQVVALSILPSITQQPVSVEAFEQTLARFQVTAIGETADGDRSQNFTWQFNGLDIPGAATNQIGTNFTYTFNSVDATNGGNYTVVVTNAAGGITSAIVTLSVDPAPTISPTNQTVSPGQQASFTVYAYGEAAFTYQWQHAFTFQDTPTNLPSANGVTFTIQNAQADDSGVYWVQVAGDYGYGYAYAFLTVGTPTPDAPTLMDPIVQGNKGQFSFSFQGAANTTYTVQYKNHLSDPSWTTLVTTNGSGGALTITDPSPATNAGRFYRILAQ